MFWYLVVISIVSMLSSDIYLPAFPTLAETFHTTTGNIQLTLSIYLLGLALGQLVYGPLSDSLGRKPVILLGTSIYVFASLACALSTHIEWMIFFRFMQALGVCACAAIWQSMVVDVYGKTKSLSVFSKIIPILSASPSLAPIIGGYITAYLSWHWLFVALAFIGSIILIITFTLIKETTTLEIRKHNVFSIKKIFANYKMLTCSRHYLGYIGIICLTEVAFFVYTAGIPFLYKNDVHLSTTQIGFVFVPQTLVFMLAGFLCNRLVHGFGLNKILKVGIATAIISCTVLLLVTLTPPQHVLSLLVPFLGVAFANGIIYPAAINEGLRTYPHIAGLASGFSGFLLLFCSFIGTSLFSWLGQEGSYMMAAIMLAPCVLATACYLLIHSKQ